MYADVEYYKNTYKGTLPDAESLAHLKQASRHIDTLTFNRIISNGFDSLTDFQQGIIKECCCMMADFEYNNADLINNLLSSYSLNGVSVAFSGEGANCMIRSGICVQRDVYKYLEQTGLCCLTFRGC